MGKLQGLSFLCSEESACSSSNCGDLHHTCCQCGMVAPQVVKEGLRIQTVMSARSLPFFQHIKPTWTFMLSRALWYPAVLSSSGDLKEDGFGSLRSHPSSQLGDSAWLPALVCLTQLFYQSPGFAAVLMWREITSTRLIAPAQKGIFLCCCLPFAALVVLYPHPEQPASPTPTAPFLEEKH